MLKGIIEVIIFDVDGTLSEEVSWLKLTHGLGASVEKHSQVFADFKAGKLSYSKAKKRLIKIWQSTGKTNKNFMEHMFESWKLKPDAQETIDYLKNASYKLCLISGAVDLYVQVVARKLGIKDWYANTTLVWDNNGNLVDVHYHADQAQKKLDHFHEYNEKFGIDKKKCAVIGDGDSDIVLFRELPYGIAVNKKPYPELEQLAYRSVHQLSDLRELF